MIKKKQNTQNTELKQIVENNRDIIDAIKKLNELISKKGTNNFLSNSNLLETERRIIEK